MESYKTMSEKLEAMLEDLQNGNLSVDDAIGKYEEAHKLITKMENYLKTAENKIKKIKDAAQKKA